MEWRRETTVTEVDNLRARLVQLAHKFSKGVFYLAFVRATAPPPNDAARRALAKMLRDKESGLVAGAVVFDGTDFRGAFVRGVATSLVILARPVFPFEVCKMEEAARLFARQSAARGLPFAEREFVRDVVALRAAFSEAAEGKPKPDWR